MKRTGMGVGLLAGLALVLCAGGAVATTWTVDDDGPADFATIQAAINAASDTDVISIAAGTYHERPVANKQLTFVGADKTTVVIDAGAGAVGGSYGFTISADNVTISDLTLLGDTGLSTPRYGFKPSGVSSFTLSNVVAREFYRTGVDLNGVTGGDLDDVTSIDNGGHGIALTDCHDVTLTSTTVSGNAWQGVSVATWGSSYALGTSGIVFDGTNSFGDVFQLEMGDAANPGVPPAGDAVITYSTDPGDLADVTVMASDFGFAVHGTQDDSPGQVRVYLVGTLAEAAAYLATPAGHFTGADMYVEDLADGSQLHVTPGGSIQAAIDAADPGDAIDIAAGTYTEAVIVNKHVDLIGAGSGSDPGSNTIVTCSSAVGPRIFTMEASGASAADPILFRDLRLEPDGVVGVEIHNGQVIAFLEFDNVIFDGTNQTNDTESEIGLRIATDGTLTDVVMTDCAFDHLTYGWYFAKTVDLAETSTAARLTVTGTSFSHNDAKGIYVEKLEDAVFDGCTVHNNGINTSFWNNPWNGGFDINLKAGTYANLTFTDCAFTDNGLYVKEGAGLLLKGRGTGTLDTSYSANPATLDNVLIEGCTFTGNERGVRCGEPGKDNATPTNVRVVDSILTGNVQTYAGVDGSPYGDLVNATTATPDASENWWGDLDPTDQLGGPGPLLVSPWLGDLPGTSPMTWYADASIQAAVDAADPGDTIHVLPGTYVEAVVIQKSLTVLGATAGVSKNGYAVPAGYAWDDNVESIIKHPTPAVGYNAIVDIYDVSDVTFDGFVVEELDAVANKNVSLVRVYADSGEIANVNVINNVIGPNTNTTAQDGTAGRMGLYLVNNPYGDQGIVNSTFAHNKIFDCQGNGDNVFLWTSYYAYGAPGPADMSGTVIDDNEIYGAHRSGIETAGGYANLVISNNTIYGQSGLPGDDPDQLKYGHGIQLIRGSSDKMSDPLTAYGPVDVVIEGNEIYGNQKCGVYMGPKNEGVQIVDNVIRDNGWDGVMLDLEGNYWNPTYESPPTSGLYACYDCAEDLSAAGNQIHGNGYLGNPIASHGMQMVGVPTNGLVIAAEGNWWGDTSGPLDTSDDTATGGLYNPTGQGDRVTDHIDYDPWLGPAGLATVPAASGPLTCGETVLLTFELTTDEYTPDVFGFNAVVRATSELTWGPIVSLAPFGATTQFYTFDQGDGSYLISGTTVGSPTQPISGAGTTGLFTIEFTTAGDGTGAVSFDSFTLRDPTNAPITAEVAGATIEVDCTPPAAVTGITAAPGHNKVEVTWTHDLADVDHFLVYRGLWYDTTPGVSAYPEYDDLAGDVIPTRPGTAAAAAASAEWMSVDGGTVTTAAFTDTWPDAGSRGVYYYEVFPVDAAGNVGGPAPANDRATNYWLGDVTRLGGGAPDGVVNNADMSDLGAAFGRAAGAEGYDEYVDVGPTDDWSRLGIPLTDNLVDFEDLMVFAMNYGVVTPAKAAPREPGTIVLAWVRYDDGRLGLRLVEGEGLKGLSVRAAAPVSAVEAGRLLAEQVEPTFLRNVGRNLDVSLAVLGTDVGLAGTGDLFVLDAETDIAAADLAVKARGVDNRDLEIRLEETSDAATPRAFALDANYPNPFNPTTTIRFSLPEAQRVRLSVYGVDGKLVATLVDEPRAAGRHEVTWTGRDDDGQAVASGVYFCRIEAGPHGAVRKMTLMK